MALEGRQPPAFFRAAVPLDWFEVIDLAGDKFQLISEMELNEAAGFLDYLRRQRNEEKIFLRWIAGPQYEMSLDEFKQKLTPLRIRSDEEILDEVYAVFEKAGIK